MDRQETMNINRQSIHIFRLFHGEILIDIVINKIAKHYQELKKLSPKELVETRMEKYSSMGVFKG